MSFRGRSESPGCKSGSKRSVSQETNYSGDAFYNSLQEDDYKLIDQTVELGLDAEFYDSSSRYRTGSPPGSPGKRKVDELDSNDANQQHTNKRHNPPVVVRSDSVTTTATSRSSSVSETLPEEQPHTDNTMHVVAFSPAHQPYFDRHLSWGAQWEIARLVTVGKLSYDDICMQSLTPLHGKDNEHSADIVEKLLTKTTVDTESENVYLSYFARELSVRNPWVELDLEEKKLKENHLSGLGCNDLHNDWYGGNIAFKARVRKGENVRKYSLQLERPEVSTSTRFGRRWGSRRIIRVRIPDDLLRDKSNDLFAFFKQDFVVHGRIFRSLFSKEHNVFLVELGVRAVDEHTRQPDPTGCVSFFQYLEWHNPMPLNKKQTLAKWCARMALAFSNSVPGLKFRLEDIHEVDDMYSPEGEAARSQGKSPDSKFILTDGTGYCNYAVLSLLRDKLRWDRLPSAIQFRMFGAKGLLMLHPTEEMRSDVNPQIWLRPSQKKIHYEKSPTIDPAHLILDVLRQTEFRSPARLSTQVIVNLAENSVPYDTLQELMDIGLDEIAADLTTWTGPHGMQLLWDTVSKINGSIFYARAAREAVGKSRVLGLRNRDWEEENDNEEEELLESPLHKSTLNWTDEISGRPATLEETAMVLLDAGFEPQSCGILAKTLKEIFKKALLSYIDRYKIVVPLSGEGWMVPDPYGVLEPGEIFIKASRSMFEVNGTSRDHLKGPVLITRHPCCVPSDVQKVQAVWRDELARYTDVIVCSTRGPRSLASMLGGGDYDGDTAHLIWDPRIVENFRNGDPKFADPPSSVQDAFEKDTKTVEDFLQQFDNKPINLKLQVLQGYLLSTLQSSSLVGLYSNYHDVAVYRLGYTDDEAWRLAYMFCELLDSSKTGKEIKSIQLSKDRQYNTRAPKWKESLADERDQRNQNKPGRDPPRREVGIKFIMDVLKDGGRQKYDYHLNQFEVFLLESQKRFKLAQGDLSMSQYYIDRSLFKPAEELRERAQNLNKLYGVDVMLKEISILENHVSKCHEKYKELLRFSAPDDTFARKSKQTRQDSLRKLSLLFHHTPGGITTLSQNDIELFKASHAYELDSERERKGTNCARFPYDVAMRNICLIKAQSLGPFKAVTSKFYSFLEMSSILGKLQSRRGSSGYIYIP